MNNLRLQIILAGVNKLTAPFRQAEKTSSELAAAIKLTKGQLKELEKSAEGLKEFNALKGSVKAAGDEIDSLKNKAGWMTVELSKMENPTKKQTEAVEKLWRQISILEEKQGREKTRLKELRSQLYKNGVSANDLAGAENRLGKETAEANKRLDEQRKHLTKINEAQKRLAIAKQSYQKTKELQGRLAGTGAGLIAGGTAAGATAIKPIIEFAKAENAAVGLKVSMMATGGVVRKEFGAINELANRLGNRLPGTTSELQNMMSVLIQQGMTAKSILGGVGEATAYLAVQMKLPYDQAALFSAKLQDATGTAEKDMMSLMDVIQRTYYLGVDSDNMLQAFAKLSPALSVLRKRGLDASKALAPLIVMADQTGMDGGAAGNAFRKVFQLSMDSYKVGKANAEALIGTGIKLDFSDGKGEFAGLDHLFSELAKLKKLTTEKRLDALKEIFGDDAETLQVLTIMIEKGKSGYEEVQKKMVAQADIQRRVNAQLGTLSNLWDAASGTFTNALVKFGESVSPEVKAITEWIGELSERLGKWADDNPVLSSGIMKTVAAVSALMIGMGGLSLAAAAILGPLALSKFIFSTLGIKVLPIVWRALQFGGGVFMWLGRLAMANPIGLLVTALAGAAVLIWQNWDWIKGKFSEFFKWIDEKVKAVATMAREIYESLPAAFKTTVEVPENFKPGAAMSWMQPAAAGGPNFMATMKPVTMPKQTVNSSVVHAPITVVAQPGQDKKAIATEVQKQLDAAQRKAGKQSRNSMSDRD